MHTGVRITFTSNYLVKTTKMKRYKTKTTVPNFSDLHTAAVKNTGKRENQEQEAPLSLHRKLIQNLTTTLHSINSIVIKLITHYANYQRLPWETSTTG